MSKTTIPTGGITADAIDGTKIADDAINSEHYTDGSIDTAHIGDNQVTAAKATGVGNKVLLLETTLSNSSSFTANNTILTSTYKKYIIDLINVELGSQSYLALLGSSNNGSSYNTSNNQETTLILTSAMSSNEYYTRMNNSGSAVTIAGNAQGLTNDKHLDMQIQLFNPAGGNDYKRVIFHGGYSNTSNQEIFYIGTGTFGGNIGTDALNNIKIEAGSGTLKSGTIKVYGVL